jgi:tryptophan 2,3-dioxygenase
MSNLQNVKKALKAAGLPPAFVPRDRNQVVAVNCNEDHAQQVFDTMTNHGYCRIKTYFGLDTDLQMIFKRSRG